MKPLYGSMLGALGCVFLLAAGCGGSSFSESDGQGGSSSAGTASGGQSTAGTSSSGGSVSAGETSGGSASAGMSTGGNSGGNSTGGVTTGGVSTGGVSTGGVTSGGSASGGTGGATGCEMDSDCVDCRYPKAPATKADCYCANCANTPMSKTACAANTTDYETVCKDVHLPCPAIACVLPPTPKCKSHMCVAG